MKYFGKTPKYRKSLGIFRTTMSTKDHKLTIAEVQEMAKVSDLREQILLETLLLGLRISDVSTLEWKKFEEDEFLLNTRKENVVAHIFISEEFKGLLTKYLVLLDKKNPYLFQSAKNLHLTVKHIDYMLHALAKRAGLSNMIHWHTARKLVLRTCAELGISSWSAKMLVGKSIPMSDATYLEGVKLVEDFNKTREVLRLFPKSNPQTNGKIKDLENALSQVETENHALKTRVDQLQKRVEGLPEKILDIIEKEYPQIKQLYSDKPKQ